MLPELGHLYHDSAINNSSVILDAKEFLRTREINAREQRHLDSLSKYLERAKSAGERVRNHEKWSVKQRLRSLQIKTPTLEKGLRKETQRQKGLRDRFGVSEENYTSMGLFSPAYISGTKSTRAKSSRTRHPQISTAKSLQVSSEFPKVAGFQTAKAQPTHSPSLFVSSFKINPESRSLRSPRRETLDKFLWKNPRPVRPAHPEGSNFVKRAEQVVKSLHKLYMRLLERQDYQRGAGLDELLDSETLELLQRARMVLGQSAIDDLMTVDVRNPPDYNENEALGGVPSSVVSGDNKDRPMSKGFSATIDVTSEQIAEGDSIDKTSGKNLSEHGGIKEETVDNNEKLTVEFVEERGQLPRHNKQPPLQGGELIKLTSESKPKRQVAASNVRVSSWVNSTIANRSYGDFSGNTRHNVEKTWSQISPYQALWQQNMGNRTASKDPKKRTLVTLAGKQRKTLIYR